jgi:hypothetical protein
MGTSDVGTPGRPAIGLARPERPDQVAREARLWDSAVGDHLTLVYGDPDEHAGWCLIADTGYVGPEVDQDEIETVAAWLEGELFLNGRPPPGPEHGANLAWGRLKGWERPRTGAWPTVELTLDGGPVEFELLRAADGSWAARRYARPLTVHLLGWGREPTALDLASLVLEPGPDA